jgi:transketolase
MPAMSIQTSVSFMETCSSLRLRILELAHNCGKSGSHLGGSLSLVEILALFYDSILQKPINDVEQRDRLILSKGHGALALYAVLEENKIISKDEADSFETNGTSFFAHAKRDINKGIEFSGGSLGLGLSYAIGVALGCRQKGYNNRIYVIVGDGECDEGIVWESLMCASNYKLNNVTVVVDHNGLQSDGSVESVMNSFSLKEKFSAFGFDSFEVNGHSFSELNRAFKYRNADKPIAVIANTVKGKGVSFIEGNKDWHHHTLSDGQYEKAVAELKGLSNGY